MQQTHSRKTIFLATLAAFAGNAIFGFSFMFSRIALAAATPFVMLMYRFAFSFWQKSGANLMIFLQKSANLRLEFMAFVFTNPPLRLPVQEGL